MTKMMYMSRGMPSPVNRLSIVALSKNRFMLCFLLILGL
jgi:hypothetical protein